MADEQIHIPCPCGKSSDAYCIYSSGWGHCFSCNKNFKEGEEAVSSEKAPRDLLPFGEYRSLNKRGIKEETCRKYGYFIGTYNDQPVQVAPYQDQEGNPAQKVRFPDKSFLTTGKFRNTQLFGQHLWRQGGKRVVVTEGEIDCLSVAQVLGLTWPVVSLPNGASGAKKAIQDNLEFLESHEVVVLMFDEDEPGRKAARECVDLLSPGKCAIARLPMKDANEMLQAGKFKELVSAVWEAQIARPDGIINGRDTWNFVEKEVEFGTPYPWEGLNKYLYGMRGGELVVWSAGTGIGKSAAVAEIGYALTQFHKEHIGYIALEEDVGRSVRRFMGIHLNKPIHLPGYSTSVEERRKAWEETVGTGLVEFYDHFGSIEDDNLLSKMRYLVKGCGCRTLILDHLSIIVSGMDDDSDERKTIDRIMTRLRSFSQETGCNIQLVSHLKRPDKRGHEEGAQTSLGQLRGSHAIGQLADAVIGLERNQQHPNEDMRNVSLMRVLKNRYAGLTGLAAVLRYDPETGRLYEVEYTIDDEGEVQLGPSQGSKSATQETGVHPGDLAF